MYQMYAYFLMDIVTAKPLPDKGENAWTHTHAPIMLKHPRLQVNTSTILLYYNVPSPTISIFCVVQK